MALFSVRQWPMRHQLLLAIGLILIVFQLISVFWLWHESKEQIELEVAMLIHNHLWLTYSKSWIAEPRGIYSPFTYSKPPLRLKRSPKPSTNWWKT